MNLILSLTLLVLFITPQTTQEEESRVKNRLDKVAEEIWSLEEDYISYFKEANHREILSLWHTDILAWPNSESQPAGKEGGTTFLEEKYPTPSHVIFKIDRKGIRVVGNVALTQYLLISSWTDND